MTGRMRTFALLAVALVLAGTAVWADAWALEDRSPVHDDHSAAVETVPAAVVATVAEARPSSAILPLLPLGAAIGARARLPRSPGPHAGTRVVPPEPAPRARRMARAAELARVLRRSFVARSEPHPPSGAAPPLPEEQ